MHHGPVTEGDGVPALGRREFFGLCAWRLVQAAGGAVLLAQLAERRALAIPGGEPCSPQAPNICQEQYAPNICNDLYGANQCVAGVSGQANICIAPGRNTCTGSTFVPANTCAGPGGAGENTCDGGTSTKTNVCTGAAQSNTCAAAQDGGATNTCTPAAANYCQPANANFCAPYAGGGSADGANPIIDP